MSDQDQNLYGQLYSQLLDNLNVMTPSPSVRHGDVGSDSKSLDGALTDAVTISRLTGDHDFQLLYPFLDWWWPDPPEGYIDENAYLFLSRLPLSLRNPAKAVTIYEPSDKDLYSTYRNVLLAAPKVDLGTTVSQPWVSEYSTALAESEKPTSPNQDKPGFAKMVTNGGTVISENYLVAQGKDWISELKKKAKERDSKPATSASDEETLLNVSLGLSTTVPGKSGVTLKVNDPFFGVFTSDRKWEDFSITTNDKKVSVVVGVGALTHVPIHPDPHWYNHRYLHDLAQRDSWNPPFTTKDVFGEKGLLSQKMTKFLAAYHITFKVTVSPDTYKKFEPHFKAAHGFRIGPFRFGAGANAASKHSTSWKHEAMSDTSTFKGESMADYPTIIGVIVDKILSDHGDK